MTNEFPDIPPDMWKVYRRLRRRFSSHGRRVSLPDSLWVAAGELARKHGRAPQVPGVCGWSPEVRRRNIRFLAYNPRYLIVPWVRVAHLASHVLGQMARRIAGDWERIYGHLIYFQENFVDSAATI